MPRLSVWMHHNGYKNTTQLFVCILFIQSSLCCVYISVRICARFLDVAESTPSYYDYFLNQIGSSINWQWQLTTQEYCLFELQTSWTPREHGAAPHVKCCAVINQSFVYIRRLYISLGHSVNKLTSFVRHHRMKAAGRRSDRTPLNNCGGSLVINLNFWSF